ncbi:Predicted acetyltransferase, GNAT family [Parafrankia irregularis]|uniref:Predicted acetyltransferase, GNAT family n=1 Tax=Parafrankia irregularis TaxID=795642 RepID=A0A0S4QTG7_9ACTN|nr:GNAT family N-acetyltransferase [Parafrankia irregularis]MBE3202402.1 GNAT family N-acetyltransferase [Parafrankia sp. CH37]CUU58917.1 Predicted acetyltransferase, GNAT family [Parafrankia irregularis]
MGPTGASPSPSALPGASLGSVAVTTPEAALDNPVWASLTGVHTALAIVHGRAARYPSDISPFAAVSDDTDPAAWADLADLVGPGVLLGCAGLRSLPPPGWDIVMAVPAVQLLGDDVAGRPDPEAVRLGAQDVPEMLDLVARTQPGPFERRTIELGAYLGIRRGGRLVAMAGERMRFPGRTEISAVCTDPVHRGAGFATRLIRATAMGILARGDRPFLHVMVSNMDAIRLYEDLGFRVRREMSFVQLRTPTH